MRNFCGTGSGGGGFGHDEAQSTHEHAGVAPCGTEKAKMVTCERIPWCNGTHIDGFTARHDPRVHGREAVNLDRRVVRPVVDLEWHEAVARGVSHEAVPAHRRASRRSPITAHQVQGELTR